MKLVFLPRSCMYAYIWSSIYSIHSYWISKHIFGIFYCIFAMVLKDLIKAFLWWEVLADAYILFFVLVYDVTRRESFTNLSDVWAKEVELYSTNQDCVKMLVGNKVDRVSFVISASMLKNWIPEEELLNGLWLWVYMPALCHLGHSLLQLMNFIAFIFPPIIFFSFSCSKADRLQHYTAAKV